MKYAKVVRWLLHSALLALALIIADLGLSSDIPLWASLAIMTAALVLIEFAYWVGGYREVNIDA